ncbi:TNT domain-containing protein [Paraburkholderia sp. CNPSo 3076]|uniref:TNT domain-containing protein n=1 Tax=Paraburkholderia sp. CNPSo 3076 TaxID=2940936 RepID=UPI003A5219DF
MQATGKSSFYALPSQTDSTSQQTINNLDTAALYGAALQYAAPAGAAFNTRGLPMGSYDAPYNAYQVTSPLTVQQSYVMPWFGSTTGIQFRLPQSVNSLLEQGVLAPVTLPKPPLK